MKIKEITKKGELEGFLENCKEKTFLGSWNWGEFQKEHGHKIWRLGFFNNSQLHAVALAVKIISKRGIFILIQHGPCVICACQKEKEDILKELHIWANKCASKEGASFLRIAPLWERNRENLTLFAKNGFRKAPMHANAYEATWKLDITPSEDNLMKAMRKTTRYLIRQAQKNPDIKIEKSSKREDAEVYSRLNEAVAKRQKFVPFSAGFIKKEFDTFIQDGQALWIFGKYKGEVAAGALVIFWQGIGFYHQAASLAKYAKFSIPYLLQWEAIKEAKARGCGAYDFWGYVDPKTNPRHPWAGPTLFKMGFGGKAYEYIKTQDLPLSWRYWPIFVFENLRKLKRGL